jgi:hypothetical protein
MPFAVQLARWEGTHARRRPVLSLDASIALLAATAAPPPRSWRRSGRSFEAKGISLERSAAPYLAALRERSAARRGLRHLSDRSSDALARARHDLGGSDGDWERQLAHLRALAGRAARAGPSLALRRGCSSRQPSRTVLCPGSVELPFVPGPDTVQ